VEQSAAEERACGEGDQRQEQLLKIFFPEDKSHAPDESDGAHEYPAKKNPTKGIHRVVSLVLAIRPLAIAVARQLP
jgi:hypothetical protein